MYGKDTMADRIRAIDLVHLLKEKLAFLSGGRDKNGGPILTFPALQNTEKLSQENLKCLISYLSSVPSDEVLQSGFTVVMDMRGSTWHVVKPILKVLQDHFTKINSVYIIKPDNFWQKQRTNFGSNKFSFEIHNVSLEALCKAIDPRQLTTNLGGTLSYDHDEWIELRISFEEFIWDALDVLDKLHDIEHILSNEQFAQDQSSAKLMIEEHIKLKKTITNAPIEQLDSQGQTLLKRINGNNCDADSGFSGSGNGAVLSGNADFQSAAPRIYNLVEKLHGTRNQLQNIWHLRKIKLDQCYQLRLFQQDANKMFDWIKQNRALFVGTCTDIGSSYQQASDLQESHRHFATNSMSVYVNVHRVMLVANRLLEANHYATEEIRGISANLDLEWKIFAAALDERSRLMALAVKFHQRVEQFVSSSAEWKRESDNDKHYPVDGATTVAAIAVLEQSLQKHHSLHDRITESYHEVCENGKELLDFLQKPTSPSTEDCLTQLIDYSAAAQQVLDSIHEVFHHHRELEKKWNERKMVLAQQHQLRVYEHDVQQVMQWISEHGEAFLAKYTGIGKSLNRAVQLRKRHEDFEDVAQNTYTNAEKLLEAAEQLAQSGDCDPHEIFQVAKNLEEQIHDFVRRVERRRNILNMSVSFNTNLQELWNIYESVKNEMHEDGVPDSLEAAEDGLRKFRGQRYRLVGSFVECQQEAKSLLHNLRCVSVEDSRRDVTTSIQHVETVLRQLQIEQRNFEDSCPDNEVRLELALQFQTYECFATEVLMELECWVKDVEQILYELVLFDTVIIKQKHKQVTEKIENIRVQARQVNRCASEILTQLDQSDLDMVCSGNVSVCIRVQDLCEQVQHRIVEVTKKSCEYKSKLEKYLILKELESSSANVLNWIASGEQMLRESHLNLTNKKETEKCKRAHEKCTRATEKTRAGVMQVQTEASRFREGDFSEIARDAEEKVYHGWQTLARHNEERTKMILTANNFHSTANNVYEVLNCLQSDYLRDPELNENSNTKAMIEKHSAQKAQFLHACTLVRKLGNEFLKVVRQMMAHYPDDTFTKEVKVGTSSPEKCVRGILEDILQRENQVLQLWSSRHSVIEQWQNYQKTVEDLHQWLNHTNEEYLKMMSAANKNKTKFNVKDCEKLFGDTKSRLFQFKSLSDNLISKSSILKEVTVKLQGKVEKRYNDFLRQLHIQKKNLDSSDKNNTFKRSGNATSPTELSYSKDIQKSKEFVQENKTIRRQNYIMKELLQTERIYVKDLEDCMNYYMSEMDNPDLPHKLKDQKDVLFGNLKELHNFHSEIFLKELEKYEQLPDDLGHCFVTWCPHFNLYVTYCQNKPASNQMLMDCAEDFFNKIQSKKQLNNSLSSYLIKPVQRITKYQLLLKDLAGCCKSEMSEIKEGLEVMLSVPRRANDALHLGMMQGFDEDVNAQGDIILQDSFQVFDTKQLIKKGRDRHLFLFEFSLLVCKEAKDNQGKIKYFFKSKYTTNDLLVNENMETEDSCKFVISSTRGEFKLTLKASSIETKQEWVRRLSECVEDHSSLLKRPLDLSEKQFKRLNSSSGTLDEDQWSLSETGSLANSDSVSLNSRFSVNNEMFSNSSDVLRIVDNYNIGVNGHIVAKRGQLVKLLQSREDLALVQLLDGGAEGLIPYGCLTPTSDSAIYSAPSNNDGMSHRGSKTSFPGLASTLPSEKRSGFRKWLTSASRKKVTSGSATFKPTSSDSGTFQSNEILTEKAIPANRRSKNSKSSAPSSPIIRASSSVKHLVSDVTDEEELPTTLPPPMKIVGSNFSVDSSGSRCSSACSLKSNDPSEQNMGDMFSSKLPDLNHSYSQDLRTEMEHILSETFSKSPVSELAEIKLSLCNNGDVWKKRGETAVNEEISNDVTSTQIDSKNSIDAIPPDTDDNERQLSEVELNLKKREFVLTELIETENEYVIDLTTMVEGFMAKVLERGLPDSDKGKERMVFGNIAQIHEWHRDVFAKEIQQCKTKPELLGKLFKKYERRLNMYVKYCQNKPISEYIVHKHKQHYFFEIQSEIGTKLDIADYLIKPVQRIMKYQLLLKDFLKFTERANLDCTDLKAAVEVMHVVPKLANDMMMVARMSGYPGRIQAQGKLVLHDTFLVKEAGSHAEKERKVFFFEQSVIFTELVDKKNEEKGFVFKNSIKNAELLLSDVPMSPTKFIFSKRGGEEMIELNCTSSKTKQEWVNVIKQQLDTQLDFMNALQAPITYQRNQLENIITSSSNLNNNHNSNNNNNNGSFELPNHSRIENLNCNAGGDVTSGPITPGSRDHVVKRNSSPFSSPPQSKQNNDEKSGLIAASDSDHLISNGKQSTPFAHTFDSVNTCDNDEVMADTASRTNKESVSIKSFSPSQHDGNKHKDVLKGNVISRPASAAGHELCSSYLSMNSALCHASQQISHKNSHLSAPDLSGSNSFWLSPLSPANIRSSSCKFIYPDVNFDSSLSVFNNGTIKSNYSRTSKSECNLNLNEKNSSSTVRAVEDYTALKEDEISVMKGDSLEIVAANAQGMCLVFRATTSINPAAEGWIPGHVVGHVRSVSKKGRITPRSVKRSSAKRFGGSISAHGTLSRILRKSKSMDKVSVKSDSSEYLNKW